MRHKNGLVHAFTKRTTTTFKQHAFYLIISCKLRKLVLQGRQMTAGISYRCFVVATAAAYCAMTVLRIRGTIESEAACAAQESLEGQREALPANRAYTTSKHAG